MPRDNAPQPPHMAEQEALLRTSYAAFNAHDVATTLKAMGPDVEWPDSFDGGMLHGPEAVGAFWQRQWAVLEPQFELKHFETDPDGHLVVTVIQTVRNLDGGIISQGLVRQVYEFENGLVRRMRVLL